MQAVRLLSALDLILGNGGAERDRTVDLHNAIVALFQLSYGPIPKEGKELLNTTECQSSFGERKDRQATNSEVVYSGLTVI